MEPIAKRTRSNSNKKRKYLVDLPFDIRYEILKRVDTTSKCKFSRCSKQCYQDVAKFRNYIKEVTVERVYLNFVIPTIQITVMFDDFQSILTFHRNTVNIYLCRYTEVKRTHLVPKTKSIKKSKIKEEDDDYYSVVSRHFDYIMKHSTNSRFALKIHHPDFPYEKMNLTGLKKLKSLEMTEMPYDIDLIGRGILHMEQILKMVEVVYLTNVISSVQQLQSLKAKKIVMKSKNFSSKDVNDYIKLFMNGEIHENVEDVQWLTMKGGLKLDEVIDGFDVIDKYFANWEPPISGALVRTKNGYGVAIVWLSNYWVHIKFFSESAFENCKKMIYRNGIEKYFSRETHDLRGYPYLF